MDDINDIFDEIVFIEERFQEKGHNEGLEAGQQSGYDEGFKLGSEYGIKIGSEIGFYTGCVKAWSCQLKIQESQNPRVLQAVDVFTDMLESFPLTQPQYPDLQRNLNKIRARYKQVASLMHYNIASGQDAAASLTF